MHDPPQVPEGYVELLPAAPREQALVVRALLESNGISAPLVAPRRGLHPYTRAPSPTVGVYVPEDKVEEARALLAE